MSMTLDDISIEVARALEEDIGNGDVSAQLLPDTLMVQAKIISREPMLVCGQAWVDQVFATLDKHISIKWQVKDGQWLEKPQTLCEIKGLARPILSGERAALNFLQTLSATATSTHAFCEQLVGYKTRLLDTRKTLPGLRQAQKYAVLCGGGTNHRMGLYDAFLIKENHIKACGSITKAIALARNQLPQHFIEVEVENLIEFQEALQVFPNRIMLDNFSIEMIKEAVAMRGASPCELEVSGNVELSNIKDYAKTGVDFISVGAITKSIRAIDLSLLIDEVI